ncbi:hypothetical protein KIN20_009382 [Parelaphostrongylus tenuis]|uniref:Amino acid permease/ SLC12A domain-containing protein n=1 Tax=Parelaphostrongylus tenuis TaxID=148309 RepID=A0AAD5QJK5_PARTN|nr:hypothetical protein KIN20_009382 [Parelaphostrongylus tenuis]
MFATRWWWTTVGDDSLVSVGVAELQLGVAVRPSVGRLKAGPSAQWQAVFASALWMWRRLGMTRRPSPPPPPLRRCRRSSAYPYRRMARLQMTVLNEFHYVSNTHRLPSMRPTMTLRVRKLVKCCANCQFILLPNLRQRRPMKSQKTAAKMGTIMGVFFPCIQNIFGVLFFIRMTWIVGTAGIFQAFFVVLTCVSVTFLTAISLSAIATNGVVSGGGPYYMISRNLGPELGGAVGILFYLGTTIAASMYLTGAVEIFLLYIMPEGKMFDNIYNNFRLYGSGLLFFVGMIVLAGVKVVNKFALPLVFVVLCCIFSSFLGAFVKFNGSDSLM